MFLVSQLTFTERLVIEGILDRFAVQNTFIELENSDDNWQLYLDIHSKMESKKYNKKRPVKKEKKIVLSDDLVVNYLKLRIQESIESEKKQIQNLWKDVK